MDGITKFLNSWVGILVGLTSLGAMVGASFRLGWKLGRRRALKDKEQKLKKARLDSVYAPLRASLLDVHITTTDFQQYPYFSQRLKRFKASRKTLGFRSALQQLFNRGISCSSEIEFGKEFPLEYITEVVSSNARVADSKLLGLVGG